MKEFYRCMLCSNVINEWDIYENGACSKCGSVRIKPTDLSLWEEIVQIIKHPVLLKQVADHFMDTVAKIWGQYVLRAK